ncbi:MAG: Hsp70 family protein [Myxococcaceae bacterium]
MTVPTEQKPVSLRIRLPYVSEEEFAARYGSHVGRAGIFIATRSPKPEGTALSFELILQDGTRLLRGEGWVAEVRPHASGAPSGMLIRFRRLDARSKSLIDRMCAGEPGGESEAAALPPHETSVAPASLATSSTAHSGDSQPEVERGVGIELGAFVMRAAWIQDGVPQVLGLGTRDEPHLPSALSFTANGEPVLGFSALASEKPWFGWVRGLGLEANTALARGLFSEGPYPLVSDERGEVAFQVGDRRWSALDLSTHALRLVADNVHARLGGATPRAVLCAPTDWSHRQRQALWRAAQDAGLGPLRLVQPSCGAALALGHGRGFARRRLLVCSIGASRIEATVVALTGDDLEQLAAAADTHPSPTELDAAMAALAQGTSTADALSDPSLAPLGASWATRASRVSQRALEIAGVTAQGLDETVCIGALTRLPGFVDNFTQGLGQRPRCLDDAPAIAVAGAALLGHALLGDKAGPLTTHMSEVLSAPIDVRWENAHRERLFERGTRLPAQKSLPLSPERRRVALLQVIGAGPPAYLGTAVLDSPVSLTVGRDAELRFHLSADGLLGLSIESGGTMEPVELTGLNDAPPSEPSAAPATSPEPSPGFFGRFRRFLRRTATS